MPKTMQIGFLVRAIELSRLDDCVDRGRPITTAIGTGKETVFPTQRGPAIILRLFSAQGPGRAEQSRRCAVASFSASS
jgi:hypothetical protein